MTLLKILLASLPLLACGLAPERQDAPDPAPAPNCHACTLPSDCASHTCTCVANGSRAGVRYCWACSPSEYDPLRGVRQNDTYSCSTVTE